ncbi:hypothetical protein ACGFYU_22420 [Streptomyces sp. NPDC048337]|uniref:hypothetical protein n=1 Tax=Streptomyces sp. NPDC048337 TaxID=3365535 RepID=UPI0037223113
MLGELIGEEQGEITGTRVLATDGGHAVVETTFQAAGTLLGTAEKDMGTYEAVMQADGTLFGEGQGVVMTQDGGSLTWHGSGVGRFTDSGTVQWRGAIYYETTAAAFERLTGIAVVFEFDTEESGKTAARLYEWK